MRFKIISPALLLALLLLPFSSGYFLHLHEEEYGENLVRVYREAQILWVKENFVSVFDYHARKNKPVFMMSDDDLLNLLKNHQSRLRLGIDEADLGPYIERVRNNGKNIGAEELKKEKPEAETKKKAKTQEKKPLLEEPKRIRVNKIWTKNIAKDKRILEKQQNQEIHMEKPALLCQRSFLNPFRVSVAPEAVPLSLPLSLLFCI